MRIVLDTNVLVSAIFWGGTPLRIIDLWRKNKIEAVASEPVLDEYLRTIEYLSKKIYRPDLYRRWTSAMSKMTLVKATKSFHLCRDPKDNMFIDCVVAGRARYLITGDEDLLVIEKVMSTRIVGPSKFLEAHSQHRA